MSVENKHSITFSKKKETKNTIVFEEDPVPGKPPKIGTLYVQKWVIGEATKVMVQLSILG